MPRGEAVGIGSDECGMALDVPSGGGSSSRRWDVGALTFSSGGASRGEAVGMGSDECSMALGVPSGGGSSSRRWADDAGDGA